MKADSGCKLIKSSGMDFMEVELPTASENLVHFELYSDEDGGRPLQLTLDAIDACGFMRSI